MLYIVGTPIGNLGDITLRALQTLADVDFIACEDTRQTSKLLNRHQIKKPLISYYEHNKLSRGDYLIRLLKEDKDIALVSDSGTPGISDPGFHIVKLALENNIKVVPIPGACALVTALSVAGIPADRFIFEGFLPQKAGARRKRLERLREQKKTVVLYESPYRFLKLLAQIREVFGDVEVTVAREVTKKFEEIKKDSLDALTEHFSRVKLRGEFVVVINRVKKQNIPSP